jgi:hypothetical protein
MGPSLYVPEVGRDVQRAFQQWNGEDRVWLLPWIDEPVRWQENSGRCLLVIPSETIDRIDIFHVNQDGYVCGPGAALRFPHSQMNGLLDIWLNLHRDQAIHGKCYIREAAQIDDQVRLAVPTFHGSKVEYVEKIFYLTPGPFFPIEYLDQGGFRCKWPPEGFPFPISPDAESYAFYEHEPPKDRSLHVQYLWPEPLRSLAPQGQGLDLLYQQMAMVKIIRERTDNPSKARTKAQSLATPYVQTGWSTHVHSWYWPTYCFWLEKSGGAYFETVRQSRNMETPEEIFFLDETREQWKFTAESLKEALDSGEWCTVLGKRRQIKRVWGMLGLFWSLLLEQLEQERPPTCGRCQRVLQGRKKFCGREDDIECYHERLALNRKYERQARNG